MIKLSASRSSTLLQHSFLRCDILLWFFSIAVFTSSLCHNIRFCVTTFILQVFSYFVATIDFFVATYFTSTFCCVCRDIKLLYRDKVVLPSITNSEFCVATEFSYVAIDFFAIFSSLCRDIVVFCQNKVLSSDFLYVSTLTSLLKHFSVNLSHIMLRQSCEMSRQSSFLA